MALIERQQGRRYNQSPGGYTRLFGDVELGQLLSKTEEGVMSKAYDVTLRFTEPQFNVVVPCFASSSLMALRTALAAAWRDNPHPLRLNGIKYSREADFAEVLENIPALLQVLYQSRFTMAEVSCYGAYGA